MTVQMREMQVSYHGNGVFLSDPKLSENAQAETALRSVFILENRDRLSDFELMVIVESLYSVGLQDEAARIAALDFTHDLSVEP